MQKIIEKYGLFGVKKYLIPLNRYLKNETYREKR